VSDSGQSQPQRRQEQLRLDLLELLSSSSSESQPHESSERLSDVSGILVEGFKLITGMPSEIKLYPASRRNWEKVRPAVQKVARSSGIPWPLMAGICWTESSFNPLAPGPPVGGFCVQAMGLFQICRGHFPKLRDVGIWANPENDWKDPEKSARAAVYILRQHGLGEKSIDEVLKGWGGFVTKDHRPFRDKILNRANFLLLDSFLP